MSMNPINQPRVTPVDSTRKPSNSGIDRGGQDDKAFEDLLKKAIASGPTNTDNIGMDPDTMSAIIESTKTISSTIKGSSKEDEVKEKEKTEPKLNYDVASFVAASNFVSKKENDSDFERRKASNAYNK